MLSLTPPWEPIKTVEMFKSVVYIAGESNFVGYRICIGLLRTTNPTHSPLFSGVLLLCLNHNFFYTHHTTRGLVDDGDDDNLFCTNNNHSSMDKILIIATQNAS